MTEVRHGHSVTALASGKVLAAGGEGGGAAGSSSAEIYDPESETWNATGAMASSTAQHVAISLPSGTVFVAGGAFSTNVEIYDPASRTWQVTGSMIETRWACTATLLASGKVLVAGGFSGIQQASALLSHAELFDPETGTWNATGSMLEARTFHTATALQNGKVLVVGGLRSTTAELYDPVSGQWSATGSMARSRMMHTATLLPDGQVLVTGGSDLSDQSVSNLASAEIYDPATGAWNATADMSIDRRAHAATVLSTGDVLVIGGDSFAPSGSVVLATAEVYFLQTRSWGAAPPMAEPRFLPRTTLLSNGSVLVTGGYKNPADSGAGSIVLASCEIFETENRP